ncbi:MAG: alpha/beta hydrolase [Bacteriovorax sp.]|nr:alpha/beta hydrolase [Bacteriovorax sp.]
MTANQGPVLLKNFDEKIKTAAWTTKPSWYIVAANDRMVDPTLQAGMAKKMGSDTTTIKASHVPMLSKPKEVAEVIFKAIIKLNEKSN